ncbi:phosphate ABC transporter permease subunit PstC [Jeotgalibacillus sp. R-1-5s-1]|uniref:phosphate ABC transporter permease subunit PstC n=1 Tax=Jeotgalibacillus sp. R-1-5s-1 TaxID=2555897 RepID=UPI00106B71AC|nr:phosphate ABC transporter permease subunit PstC [Jeotgalibacillus sp. R-1-5s-1]TFD92296.1 phosphate ABC transporter permease subunit PstC [Jeotgalibacillus sp. R-1-5s-1]
MAMNEPKQVSVQDLIAQKSNRGLLAFIEKLIPKLLLAIAAVSVLTTIGIVLTLIVETTIFFSRVSVFDFLTGTEWYPFANSTPTYGILPLIVGTLKIAGIATVVAVPIGIATAIFLSEYASDRVRRIVKPVLEVLAGVPTIVYGYFALTFVTPILRSMFPEIAIFNAISPGIVVGIMIIPMIASLSEDAMSSVPNAMRDGAYALGSTKLEVALKIVLPAALSGIVASTVLAISRAIGETMIVALAAGSTPGFNLDVTGSIQTMTAYIVQVTTGDAGYGTTIYYSIYAVGFTLFLFTLFMNMLAQFISKRFREEY